MFRRHPSRRTLQSWLVGELDEGLEAHVDTCERCAATLESLDSEGTTHAIGDALATVLAPPADLLERLEVGVNSRLDSREMLTIIGDLFSAGFETTRLLLVEDPDSDPR